jgi:cytochrome P450
METYDPRRPETHADPYPALAELRARNPVSWNGALRGWVVTRYGDVQTVLGDPRFASDRIAPFLKGLPPARRVALSGLERVLSRWTILADPPAHARLRGAVAALFTADATAVLEERARSMAESLIERAPADGAWDLIADFAGPLPGAVMAELLGLPAQDITRFAAWSDDVAVFLGGEQAAPNTYDRAAYRLAEMDGRFRTMVRTRGTTPSRGDAIDLLMAAPLDGNPLDEDEIVACLILVLLAGQQTATDLIGNGALTLLRHPAELARLRDNPDLLAPAIEEMARYESPTASVTRVASATAEIGGRKIARGSCLFLMLGAANRDPERFPVPDRFDIARADIRHLSFGHGAHECLGAALARRQARVAIQTWLERCPEIELLDRRPAWRPGFAQRGLASLKLRVRPR